MSYYYLVASLPGLDLEGACPFTTEEFLFSCQGPLADSDLRDLTLALEGRAAEAASAPARKWADLDTQLRNAVARQRAAQLGVDAKSYLRDHSGFDGLIEKMVADAFARPNPLEREQVLDRCRWMVLDELALEDPFGFAAVLAFGLKLQLVQRWSGITHEKGRTEFDRMVAAYLEQEGIAVEFDVEVE